MIQIKSQPLTKEVKKLYLKLKAFKGLPKTKQSTWTKFIDEELILIHRKLFFKGIDRSLTCKATYLRQNIYAMSNSYVEINGNN